MLCESSALLREAGGKVPGLRSLVCPARPVSKGTGQVQAMEGSQATWAACGSSKVSGGGDAGLEQSRQSKMLRVSSLGQGAAAALRGLGSGHLSRAACQGFPPGPPLLGHLVKRFPQCQDWGQGTGLRMASAGLGSAL